MTLATVLVVMLLLPALVFGQVIGLRTPHPALRTAHPALPANL